MSISLRLTARSPARCGLATASLGAAALTVEAPQAQTTIDPDGVLPADQRVASRASVARATPPDDGLGQLVEAAGAEASAVCDRAAQQAAAGPNGGGPSGPGGSGGSGTNGPGSQANGTGPGGSAARPCPVGAEYDQGRNLCIITRERNGNLGDGRELVGVVGSPADSPSGGRVVLVSELPVGLRRSSCAKGAGPKFAVLGTKGADRITGTNRADRILTPTGNDRVSSGRGNDCVDGGAGRDQLSGSQGRDRLISGAGNDALNGGSSADVLSGGTGNDSINAAFGADRVSGGSGRDVINVATAGPSARVNCGSGRDKLRANRKRAAPPEGLRDAVLHPLIHAARGPHRSATEVSGSSSGRGRAQIGCST